MKLRWLTIGVVAVSAVAGAVAEDALPAPASAPSLKETFRGLRDKLRGRNESAAAQPATAGDTAPATQGAPQPPGATAPMQLKSFAIGSRLPGKWNDTHCKNLVEPFDLVDGAASLAKLKVEVGLGSMLGNKKLDERAEVRKAARTLNWLPGSTEYTLGQKNHETLRPMREDKGKEHYARARRLLQETLAPLAGKTPYKFQIFVMTDSGGNAESGPGGFIYVDSDLVAKAEAEPRARFAIAHEVAHVLQRHRTRETQVRLAEGIDSLQDLGKLMTSARGGLDALSKKSDATKKLFVRHSEDQELQSDGCAVRLLDMTVSDRGAMIRSIADFVQSLPQPSAADRAPAPAKQQPVFSDWGEGALSRHPSTQQRVKNLNAVLAELRAGVVTSPKPQR